MKITKAEWNNYKNTMSLLSDTASKEFSDWVNQNGGWESIDRQIMAEAAYSIASKYSEGSSALAAQMYDSIAKAENVNVPEAEMAAEVDFGQLATAINGALKHSTNDDFVSAPVGRAVKQAGADTMLLNAKRDQAEFAWVPSGDSCAFCLALAANGWQRASKRTIAGNHAKHIHTNCDCQFVIRFDKNTQVEGYNPEEYQEIYNNAEGKTSAEKIKYIRNNVLSNQNQTEKPLTIATNREEAYSIIKTMFSDIEDRIKSIPDELLIDNTNQLNKLNARFKAITPENIGLFQTTTDRKVIASTYNKFRSGVQETNLNFNLTYYRSEENLVSTEIRGRKAFFSMPFDDGYLKTFTLTHEYGHILEASISRKRTNWEELDLKFAKLVNPSDSQKRNFYKDEEKRIARTIYEEIVAIAKERNPDFSMKKNLSEYGHTNSYEFFAEVFANSQCGEPNELGEAMNIWLEREGF